MKSLSEQLKITMEDLGSHVHDLAPGQIQHWIEQFAYSMEMANKHTPATFLVKCMDSESQVEITFTTEVLPSFRRTYVNQQTRTERSAEAVALLSLPGLVGHTVVQVAPAAGNRFDFYTLPNEEISSSDDMLIFNDPKQMMLEVSGIEAGKAWKRINSRVKEKTARLNEKGGPGSDSGRTHVFVVEFSETKARLILA